MKKKGLVVAEKPDLMRKLQNVYKKHKEELPYEIDFKAQRGHLTTLKLPNELDPNHKWILETLPFEPENFGGFKYKLIQEPKKGNYLTAQERFYDIKKAIDSGRYDFVIHCGDPDQEGEILVSQVLNLCSNKLPVKRFWSNDVTEPGILDALKNLKDDDNDPMLVNLRKAGFARQHSDYRVGMNFSQAASIINRPHRFAIGRVKTVILKIVCDREKAIKNFTPKTVYGVELEYDKGFSGQLYNYNPNKTEADQKDENKNEASDSGYIWFETVSEAEDVIRNLKEIGRVIKVKKETKKSYAPKLFTLGAVQVAAGKYGLSPKKTLDTIQSLYEKTYITYPRTDCEYISSNEDLYGILGCIYKNDKYKPFVKTISKNSIEEVRKNKKYVNDEKLLEAGHSALHPTNVVPDFDSLDKTERFIYDLISKQFLAIFLPPLIEEAETIITEFGSDYFKSTGKVVVDKGYTVIFGQKLESNGLPAIAENDSIKGENAAICKKTSTCPKHLTQTDIIAICENPTMYLEDKSLKDLKDKRLKIGTEATRADIIIGLITKDKYLEEKTHNKRKILIPTKDGYNVYRFIRKFDVAKVDMTAKWELKLQEIRLGHLEFEDYESDMRKYIREQLEIMKGCSATAEPKRVYDPIGKCPNCGKELKESDKGYYCSGFKDGCKVGCVKVICEAKISREDFIDLLQGRSIIKKMKKDSKTWKQKLKLNPADHYKLEFIRKTSSKADSSNGIKTQFICSNCQEHLVEEQYKYTCNCGFELGKTLCSRYFDEDEIKELLQYGVLGKKKGYISKTGKKFSAALIMDKKTGKCSFDFSDLR